jgi:hypothetical protein
VIEIDDVDSVQLVEGDDADADAVEIVSRGSPVVVADDTAPRTTAVSAGGPESPVAAVGGHNAAGRSPERPAPDPPAAEALHDAPAVIDALPVPPHPVFDFLRPAASAQPLVPATVASSWPCSRCGQLNGAARGVCWVCSVDRHARTVAPLMQPARGASALDSFGRPVGVQTVVRQPFAPGPPGMASRGFAPAAFPVVYTHSPRTAAMLGVLHHANSGGGGGGGGGGAGGSISATTHRAAPRTWGAGAAPRQSSGGYESDGFSDDDSDDSSGKGASQVPAPAARGRPKKAAGAKQIAVAKKGGARGTATASAPGAHLPVVGCSTPLDGAAVSPSEGGSAHPGAVEPAQSPALLAATGCDKPDVRTTARQLLAKKLVMGYWRHRDGTAAVGAKRSRSGAQVDTVTAAAMDHATVLELAIHKMADGEGARGTTGGAPDVSQTRRYMRRLREFARALSLTSSSGLIASALLRQIQPAHFLRALLAKSAAHPAPLPSAVPATAPPATVHQSAPAVTVRAAASAPVTNGVPVKAHVTAPPASLRTASTASNSSGAGPASARVGSGGGSGGGGGGGGAGSEAHDAPRRMTRRATAAHEAANPYGSAGIIPGFQADAGGDDADTDAHAAALDAELNAFLASYGVGSDGDDGSSVPSGPQGGGSRASEVDSPFDAAAWGAGDLDALLRSTSPFGDSWALGGGDATAQPPHAKRPRVGSMDDDADAPRPDSRPRVLVGEAAAPSGDIHASAGRSATESALPPYSPWRAVEHAAPQDDSGDGSGTGAEPAGGMSDAGASAEGQTA